MPATSTRTSTCRTEPRRGAAATTLLLLTTAGAVPAHAALRLDAELRPSPRESRASVPQPTPPLDLRLDRILPAPRGEGPAKGPLRYEERLVEVDLNEQGINKSVLVLRRGDGMFLLPHGELASFRLKTPSTAPYIHDDVAYFPVDALPGARFVFDEARQRLAVTAGPDAFEATLENVPHGAAYPAAVRPSPGVFLNYQLSAVRGGGTGFEFGNFEAGLFSKYGVLINTMRFSGPRHPAKIARDGKPRRAHLGQLERLVEAALAQSRSRQRRRYEHVGTLFVSCAFGETLGQPAADREIARVLVALHQPVEREAVGVHGHRAIVRGRPSQALAANAAGRERQRAAFARGLHGLERRGALRARGARGIAPAQHAIARQPGGGRLIFRRLQGKAGAKN